MRSQWLNPPADGRRFMIALGAGLLLEMAALLLLLPIVTHQAPPADKPSIIKLSIVVPAPAPKPPAPPKPVPVPPKPVAPPPPPLPVAKPLPIPPPPPRPSVHHVVRHYIRPKPVTPPPVVEPPVQQTPPAPPPPAAPQAPTGGEVDAFRAAMKRAVQAVVNQVYPAAAQMAHETGVLYITFTYLNGVVTDISLAQSSGFPLLDQAGLQAARIAQYPPPPPGFAGRTYSVTVSVIFQLAAPSVDSD